jgi:uncharacterized protein
MLGIDLARLARTGSVEVDTEVPADDPLWNGTELELAGPLGVRMKAEAAGRDVVVRGRLRGSVAMRCRRCLTPVRERLDEEVTFLYREEGEEADEESYLLPRRGKELDLGDAVREHVMLAVPRYVVCSPSCRGLCPRCGTDLNEGSCDCVEEEEDERWAPLRRLKGQD